MALKAFEVFGEVSLKGAEQVKRGLKGLTGGGGGMATAFAGGGAAVAAAGAVAVGAAAKFALMAEEEATANARIRNIVDSMGLFGDASGEVTDRLTDLARKQALATGIDDGAIKMTQAKLLTFKELAVSADEVGGAFDRATTAALDMEAAGFGSAEQNAVQLGKALQDPIKGITALARSGVTFTEAEKERIAAMMEAGDVASAQNEILKAIETQVGGTAEATANMSDRMKVAWDEIQEGLGERVLPLFEKAGGFVLDTLLPAFDSLMSGDMSLKDLIPPEIVGIFETIGRVAAPVIDTLKDSFANFKEQAAPALESVKNAWEQLQPVVELVAGVIGAVLAVVLGVVIGVVNGIVNAIAPLAQAIGGIVAIVSGIVNLIVGIFTGDGEKINAAIDGIVQGIADVFGGLWGTVEGFITGFVDGVVGFFTGLWDTLVGHSIVPDMINGIIKWFTELPGRVLGVLRTFITNTVAEFGKLAVQTVRAIDTMVANVIGALRRSPIFGPMVEAAETVMRLIGQMRDTVVRVLKDLLGKIRKPINDAKNLLDKLNPFHRESPSLVDNVLAGTNLIGRAYTGLSGMDIAGPSVGGMTAGAGASGVGAAGVIIIADPRYTDMDKVRRDARALQRGDISVGSIYGRMGMAT